MPFPAVENLAALDASAAERKRREELARLQQDEAHLADQAAEQKAAARSGPAGVLESLMKAGGRSPAVAGNVLQGAEEDRFLNEQATRRLGRQADALGEQKSRLSIPPPSPAERYNEMAKPLGRFATEDPATAAGELRTDPRGRLAELNRVKDQITGTVPRETSGADRFYYREEPSQAAPGESVLSFTNRPERASEPGFHRYNSDTGTTKDLGAPGGGLSTIGNGGPDHTPQAALLQDLGGMIGQAERQRLTPQEMAQDLVTQEPGWDAMAAKASGPAEVEQLVNEAVAAQRLRPETGQYLQRKYAGIGNQAFDERGEFQPEIWQGFLTDGRKPAPGEAEARARTGGQQVAEAAQQEHAAVQDALQPAEDAPGSTQSPALIAESTPNPQGSPTPQQTPQGVASRRLPMPVEPGVESLDELLAMLGVEPGMQPGNAVGARERDALLRSLGR